VTLENSRLQAGHYRIGKSRPMNELYYDIFTNDKDEIIDDLWEYELHFIAHADIMKLAESHFKEALKGMSMQEVLDHHKKVIGDRDNAL